MSIVSSSPFSSAISPEMQAAIEAAQAQIAAMTNRPTPPNVAQLNRPPKLAKDLLAWGHFKLKPAGEALLTPEITSVAFFETLFAADCLADARRVLSHSMPKRRALWWATLAGWDLQRAKPDAELEEALGIVGRYVISPTEELRREVGAVAQRLPVNTLAGCLAQAAFFSAGSVSLPNHPPVAPRPFVTGRLVGVCVYLASVKRNAALYKQYLREYLRWGRAIASGELLWPTAEAAPSTISRVDSHMHALTLGRHATAVHQGAFE